MSIEEVIEIYIPDDPEIQEFHSLCNVEKLKIIKLGLALYKSGNQKLQYLNNDEWEKQIESIKEIHNTFKKIELVDIIQELLKILIQYNIIFKIHQVE